MEQDGYTKEVSGPEGVRVLVAQKAKPNKDKNSPLDREFFISFLDVSISLLSDDPFTSSSLLVARNSVKMSPKTSDSISFYRRTALPDKQEAPGTFPASSFSI